MTSKSRCLCKCKFVSCLQTGLSRPGLVPYIAACSYICSPYPPGAPVWKLASLPLLPTVEWRELCIHVSVYLNVLFSVAKVQNELQDASFHLVTLPRAIRLISLLRRAFWGRPAILTALLLLVFSCNDFILFLIAKQIGKWDEKCKGRDLCVSFEVITIWIRKSPAASKLTLHCRKPGENIVLLESPPQLSKLSYFSQSPPPLSVFCLSLHVKKTSVLLCVSIIAEKKLEEKQFPKSLMEISSVFLTHLELPTCIRRPFWEHYRSEIGHNSHEK